MAPVRRCATRAPATPRQQLALFTCGRSQLASILGGFTVGLFGLIMLFFAGKLAMAGGSWFYIVISIGLILSGIELMRRRQTGFLIYAGTLIVTFIWTIYEVGFDKWQWIPRGALLVFIGLILLIPIFARDIRRSGHPAAPGYPILGATIGGIVILGIISWFIDPAQTKGELPVAQNAGDPAVDPSGVPYPADEWTAYGGTNLGQRYSALKDINLDNVKGLKVAWEHHTGDLRQADQDSGEYTFEATPIKADGRLYFCTPHNIVQALEPETGKLLWSFDPQMQRDPQYQHQTCRGVSWNDSSAFAAPAGTDPAQTARLEAAIAECPRRIVATTVDARLYTLNPETGALCKTFGTDGYVNLLEGMTDTERATYMETSAPLVTNDLIILGSAIADNYYENNPSGVIRAFDVRTGQVVWKFDAGDPTNTAPLQPGETYVPNSAVAWTQLSADENLGMVYVPFGNKSPDQIGVARTEEDYAMVDALAALDLRTGQLRWKYQTSLHDLWDRDNPSQPVLITLPHDGQDVPSVIVPTKGGNLFVLDRRTGAPVLPVSEMQVSTETDIPNEKPSPVQPMSSLTFTPPPLKESDMWGTTPFDQMACRKTFVENRYDGNPFTPPTLTGSIVWPGNIGVFNWGSVAVDPVNKWLIGTPQFLPYLYKLYPRPADDLDERLFSQPGQTPGNENLGGPYGISIKAFRSTLGVPCQAPPWGVRVGVDLTNGKTAWELRNGTVAGQKFLGVKFPIPFEMGMLAHGGTLTTAGGVAFTAASLDDVIRAYDMRDGTVLWKQKLPAGGQATPMTYRGKDGKQYVVLAAGGHGSLGTTLGDSVIAYTLE
ncbi:MAG: membrane-bound PQQ-dependent dehydrogenase, glucose/quinate/shikimate family [Paracoccus denitrificans]|nr:MAG: membrane-bound PQQ-dependent dehydrogenase, glucose/quinate/shikimate family [Paracoccus denitrificans]PZO84450.1 MAG: membrane-bound PQQ-dependent dehydrogenase, glucose/quinate/shikimate family [Paracoccus denitrificans]